jgi:hypothetical protein
MGTHLDGLAHAGRTSPRVADRSKVHRARQTRSECDLEPIQDVTDLQAEVDELGGVGHSQPHRLLDPERHMRRPVGIHQHQLHVNHTRNVRDVTATANRVAEHTDRADPGHRRACARHEYQSDEHPQKPHMLQILRGHFRTGGRGQIRVYVAVTVYVPSKANVKLAGGERKGRLPLEDKKSRPPEWRAGFHYSQEVLIIDTLP